ISDRTLSNPNHLPRRGKPVQESQRLHQVSNSRREIVLLVALIGMQALNKKAALAFCALWGAVSFAYSNHFGNSFHFDDSHTIVENSYIRDLHYLPLFFTDTRTFSSLPANRSYRPLVTASLAIDYALAHGLNSIYFQASTFFWFLVQLLLMYALFRKVGDMTVPDPRNRWMALF